MILADYLGQHGDPRGELIVLQSTPTGRTNVLASRLITQHGKHWLGLLSRLCTRRGTEWRRGMVEEIRIGMLDTPVEAFAAVRGHRELGCVRSVIGAQIAPPMYAAVVHALPNVPRYLGLEAIETISELRKLRATWPLHAVELGGRDSSGGWGTWTIDAMFDALARIAPDITSVTILPKLPLIPPRNTALAAIARIREWFPQLAQLRAPATMLDEHEGLRALAFATGYAGAAPGSGGASPPA